MSWNPELSKQMQMLKCIKCGSTEALTPYKHKQVKSKFTWSTKYNVYEHESIIVPTCRRCGDEFDTWVNKMEQKKRTTACLACPMCIVVGLIFGLLIPNILALIFFVPLIVIFLLVIYESLVMSKFRAKETSPFRYVRIKKGFVSINSLGTSNWIPHNDWMESTLLERSHDSSFMNIILESDRPKPAERGIPSDDFIFCRKCGLQNQSSSQFCERCGNQLG